jgi:hypothetical protein
MDIESLEIEVMKLVHSLGLGPGHMIPPMALMAEFKRLGLSREDMKAVLDSMKAKGWLSERDILTSAAFPPEA